MLHKSMDWFLYDDDLRHERVKKYHALAHCICIYIAIVWLAIEIK